MKTDFSKKTIKIFTATTFSIFVLMLFFAISHVYAETTEIKDCDWSYAGQCVVTTKEIEEDVTNIDEWKTSEEYEKALEDLNSPEGTWDENQLEDSGNGDKFTYTLLQSLPKEGPDLEENVTLEEYLTWAFRFILALAGFLAVMMIVIGGVEYIISGASESMRGEAKKRIENAIWGLVMALVSYLVLYTINPSLV